MINMIYHTLLIKNIVKSMKAENVKLKNKIRRSLVNDKLYGTTTLGARGQVVIPAAARKDLGLNPGDQILVMGHFGRVLGLIKAEQLGEIIKAFMNQWLGTRMEKVVKNFAKKIPGDLLRHKNN